jgi:hypothetical protein
MSELEARLWMCLMELVSQVDEDCPHEYRTRHLKDALSDAIDLINEVHEIAKTGDE